MQCDAFVTYQVYQGTIDNAALINILQARKEVRAQIALESPRVVGPATGSLALIPEPSSTLILSLSALVVVRRKR